MPTEPAPGKYQTPRVPIETPMFDDRGLMTRTWIIYFERLGKRQISTAVEAPGGGLPAVITDYEYATWVIDDTAVGANASNLLSVRRGGTLVDAEIVPKTNTTADFEFDILLTHAGDVFSSRASIFDTVKLFVPSGTAQGTVITQNVFATVPYLVAIDDVLSSDILTGGSSDIYSAILKWKVG